MPSTWRTGTFEWSYFSLAAKSRHLLWPMKVDCGSRLQVRWSSFPWQTCAIAAIVSFGRSEVQPPAKAPADLHIWGSLLGENSFLLWHRWKRSSKGTNEYFPPCVCSVDLNWPDSRRFFHGHEENPIHSRSRIFLQTRFISDSSVQSKCNSVAYVSARRSNSMLAQ